MEKTTNVFINLCQKFSEELEQQTFETGVEEVQFIYAVVTAFTADALRHIKDKMGELAGIDDVLIVFLEDLQKELGQEEHE